MKNKLILGILLIAISMLGMVNIASALNQTDEPTAYLTESTTHTPISYVVAGRDFDMEVNANLFIDDGVNSYLINFTIPTGDEHFILMNTVHDAADNMTDIAGETNRNVADHSILAIGNLTYRGDFRINSSHATGTVNITNITVRFGPDVNISLPTNFTIHVLATNASGGKITYFDANFNNYIERSEAITGVVAYFDQTVVVGGTMQLQDIVELIGKYFLHQQIIDTNTFLYIKYYPSYGG